MKKIRNCLKFLILAFVLFATTACVLDSKESADDTALVHAGDVAPDFTVEMFDRSTVTLSKLQGKVVLLTFFDTTCTTCQEMMPLMQEHIVDRFAGQEFAFLPIARGGDYQTVGAFRDDYGLTYPMGIDPDRSIYRLYATKNVPRHFVIDREGTVIFSNTDFSHVDKIMEEIFAAIEEVL